MKHSSTDNFIDKLAQSPPKNRGISPFQWKMFFSVGTFFYILALQWWVFPLQNNYFLKLNNILFLGLNLLLILAIANTIFSTKYFFNLGILPDKPAKKTWTRNFVIWATFVSTTIAYSIYVLSPGDTFAFRSVDIYCFKNTLKVAAPILFLIPFIDLSLPRRKNLWSYSLFLALPVGILVNIAYCPVDSHGHHAIGHVALPLLIFPLFSWGLGSLISRTIYFYFKRKVRKT